MSDPRRDDSGEARSDPYTDTRAEPCLSMLEILRMSEPAYGLWELLCGEADEPDRQFRWTRRLVGATLGYSLLLLVVAHFYW